MPDVPGLGDSWVSGCLETLADPENIGERKVKVPNGHRLHSIDSGKVPHVSNGNITGIGCLDSIVLAPGFRPSQSITEDLQGIGADVYQIGDGRKVSSIMQAIWDGFEVGNNI